MTPKFCLLSCKYFRHDKTTRMPGDHWRNLVKVIKENQLAYPMSPCNSRTGHLKRSNDEVRNRSYGERSSYAFHQSKTFLFLSSSCCSNSFLVLLNRPKSCFPLLSHRLALDLTHSMSPFRASLRSDSTLFRRNWSRWNILSFKGCSMTCSSSGKTSFI